MATPTPTYAPPPKAPRYVRLVPAGSPLLCPRGHRIKDGDLGLEHGAARCRHKASAGGAECGALLYVLLMVPSGWRFLAEVTILDLRHMQTVGMDVNQSLRFLGLDGPLTQTPEQR